MYSICSADLNWFLVDTVEVNSCEGSAVVANNDTIWIHHWYKLEDIVTAETLYGRWKGEGRGSRGERIPIKRARILCTIKYCDILWFTDPCVGGVSGEALYHTLHHPATVGLPWVDPG